MKQDAMVWAAAIVIMTWVALVGRAYQAPPHGSGSLVICGGGPLPAEIRQEFVRLAGGPDARIVVIPTATTNADSTQYLENLKHDWAASGEITVLHTRDRKQADDLDFVQPLREATGVWFTGGDQVLLADTYLGTHVHAELLHLLERGGVIGGTSAGAAVMSQVMIAGGESVAEVGEGFGFLTEAVVDQHFLKRKRMGRLAGVVATHPGLMGIGIDEETALVVQGDTGTVLGNSCVLTCSGRGYESHEPGDQIKLRSH